jgi:hypothetical protein
MSPVPALRFRGAMTIQDLTTIRLDVRENGPNDASNGGFAAGTIAGLIGGTAEVRLTAKVPLGVDLDTRVDGTQARVEFGGRTLATALATDPFVLEPPVRPTIEEAARARQRHPYRGVRHPLSNCVVCGPERTDGLRVTPGALDRDIDVLATPFVPTERFAVDGSVRAAAVWGALDCPGYPAEALRSGRFCLLGSLEAHQVRPLEVGEEFVVVGWTVGTGRRSTRTASAIIDENGRVVASARAVWVAVRDPRVNRVLSRVRA